MKVGAQVVTYRGADFLAATLRALEPLDVVLVSIAPDPWSGPRWPDDGTYNIAREFVRNGPGNYRFHGSMVAPTEAQQRNEALDILAEDGCDLVMIVDDDEVWERAELESFLRGVEVTLAEPNPPAAWLAHAHQLWKTPEWRVEPDCHYFTACVDPRRARFLSLRNTDAKAVARLDGPRFHHLSYVRKGDQAEQREKIRRKLASFSHAGEIAPGWLEGVWDRWSPAARNLCPTQPAGYERAVPHRLPAEVAAAIGWENGGWKR